MVPEWLKELISLKIFPSLKNGKLNVSFFKNLSFIKIINKPQIDNRSISSLPPIVWSQLNPSQQKALKSAIYKSFKKDGSEVLDGQFVDEANDYVEKEKNGDDSEIISYFQGKIPDEDIYILKASSYIEKIFQEGKDIHNLKKQLRYKYGQRGISICNLYSADYYRTWIKPLYDTSPNQESFVKAYELVIQQSPFAIFVNRDMSVRDIENKVKSKISESKLYGIKIVNVHGIGSDNINKIVKAMENLTKEAKNLEVSYESFVMFVAKVKLRDKKE